MSQIYKTLTSGGPIPPIIPTSFDTDDGTAIPAANILNVNGIDSTENNVNGILTRATPDLSDNLQIIITNRLQGTVSTVGAATSTLISFTPTVIGTYSFEFRIAAYNTTSLLGAGASVFGAIRFDGVNANICDLFDEINNDEGAMSGTDISITTSVATMNLQVTGYALQTINWSAVGLYTFVGA